MVFFLGSQNASTKCFLLFLDKFMPIFNDILAKHRQNFSLPTIQLVKFI